MAADDRNRTNRQKKCTLTKSRTIEMKLLGRDIELGYQILIVQVRLYRC